MERAARKPAWANKISAEGARHPVLTIWFAALLAVAINCYPIVFFGRSYVSPASIGTGGSLVYSSWPPLPGMDRSMAPAERHGRDTWATMLWSVPAGFIASRSLLEQGELPLWNRYGHAGDTFIGQAISMLGDPLQLIVILGRGSAVAWDIKFLMAKFLFSAGFGLLVWRLLGGLGLAILYAILAAYCGAFFYIINHPVFFVFCYAPWILLAAIGLLDGQSRRPIFWGWVWLLANVGCFNAGHIEVAVDLIGALNLAALLRALSGCAKPADSLPVLRRLAVGTVVFLGLTAPVWISFLGALGNSHTGHDTVGVVQLPTKCLPGIFDDAFDSLLAKSPPFYPLTPETGLLVLVGFLIALWQWRQLKADSFFWINCAAVLFWAGFVFGWIPAGLITGIPFLNRVGHIHTDFSYLIVLHLTLLSAYGFKALAALKPDWRTAIVLVGGGLVLEGAVMWCYGHRLKHWSSDWNYLLGATAGAVGAPLLYVYFKSRDRQLSAIHWLAICVLGFLPNYRFGLYHASPGNDAALMIPGPRVALNAPSPAIDKIKADHSAPYRVVGLGQNLCGDYAAVYGLEGIYSCAPLANGGFIPVLENFPGIQFDGTWMISIVDVAKAQPLLNLLNVKYLLASPAVDPPTNGDFRVADRSDFNVLENLQVWPRAFFANEFVAVDSDRELTEHLWRHGEHPFIGLSRHDLAGLPHLSAAGQPAFAVASHFLLRPDSTEFDIHAPAAGVVCLTEGPTQDFTAEANRTAKEILTVNRGFKGVALDQPGDYHIKFTYHPRHWRLACTWFWISIGGALMLTVRNFPQCQTEATRPLNDPHPT